MKRLGKFSGRIYNSEEAAGMKECGIVLTNTEAADEEYIKNHHKKDYEHCITCMGCPMAQGITA